METDVTAIWQRVKKHPFLAGCGAVLTFVALLWNLASLGVDLAEFVEWIGAHPETMEIVTGALADTLRSTAAPFAFAAFGLFMIWMAAKPRRNEAIFQASTAGALQQTVEPLVTPPIVAPSVECVRTRNDCYVVEQGGGWAEIDSHNLSGHFEGALVAVFRNTSNVSAEVVRAHIEYYDKTSLHQSVDYGCWLGEEVNWSELDPGDSAQLLIVLLDSASVAIDDRRREAGRGAGSTPKVLTKPKLTVKVTIRIADGNFKPAAPLHEAWFDVRLGGKSRPEIRKIERPSLAEVVSA